MDVTENDIASALAGDFKAALKVSLYYRKQARWELMKTYLYIAYRSLLNTPLGLASKHHWIRLMQSCLVELEQGKIKHVMSILPSTRKYRKYRQNIFG